MADENAHDTTRVVDKKNESLENIMIIIVLFVSLWCLKLLLLNNNLGVTSDLPCWCFCESSNQLHFVQVGRPKLRIRYLVPRVVETSSVARNLCVIYIVLMYRHMYIRMSHEKKIFKSLSILASYTQNEMRLG